MKVKMLRSVAIAGGKSLQIGHEADVDDDLGKALVDGGAADEIKTRRTSSKKKTTDDDS